MGILNRIFSGEGGTQHRPDSPVRTDVKWEHLVSASQLDEISRQSAEYPVLIFKHSTRCSISSMALSRIEKGWDFEPGQIKAWYLDLIAYREVSNQIAAQFGIPHESPQVILLINGKAVYDASHSAISVPGLRETLERS